MPLLRKEILPENTYLVNSNQGRIKRKYDEPYLNRLAANSNEMLLKGYNIPVPFVHHKDAKPWHKDEPEILVNHGAPQSSFDNAGYWQSFSVTKDANGKAVFVGYTDLPGSDEDTSSPYYKAKNSAKEVSISIYDTYKDGLGIVWKDVVMHAALVNHPVVPNQKEFEDVATIVNMSMLDEEDCQLDSSVISQLITALKESVGIVLPASTNAKTILRDLLVAASQIRPNGGQQVLEPVPIYMSTGDNNMLTEAQAKDLVTKKIVNSATSKPYTMEELGYKTVSPTVDLSAIQTQLNDKDAKIDKLTTLINGLMTSAVNQTKDLLTKRIRALVERGLPKDQAEASLVPQLEVQLSTLIRPDGSIGPHPLEVTLSSLEALFPVVKAPSKGIFDGVVQPPPYGEQGSMTPEDQTKAIDELISFIQ